MMNNEEHRRRSGSNQLFMRRHQMFGEYPMPTQPGHPVFCSEPPPYWRNTSPHGAGPRHFYPVLQSFMQHGPFGNDGNQFHPARFPRFPSPAHYQHLNFSGYNTEQRRNGNHYPPENMQDMGRFRHDYRNRGQWNNHGYNNNNEGGGEYGQGARPKTSSAGYQRDRHRPGRRKRYHNSHSKQTSAPMTSVTDKASHVHLAETKPETTLCRSQSDSNPSLNCINAHMCSADSNDNDGDELVGAVGGGSDSNAGLPEDPSVQISQSDKNLIDEGAICDLDNMFQHQEFSRLNGGGKHLGLSDDDDDDCEDVGYSENIDGATKIDSDILTEDDSEGEKSVCPDFLGAVVTSREAVLVNHNHGQLAGVGVRHGVDEDAEDTGDFIDTDLPAQCLSSSDETDNASFSDEHSFQGDSKQTHSDINCNNLPIPGSDGIRDRLGNLKIGEPRENTACSFVSPLQLSSRSKGSAVDVKRHKRRSSHRAALRHIGSSDSDSDGNPPRDLMSNSQRTRAHEPLNICLEGAAASQGFLQKRQFERTSNRDLPNPLPSGADSEILAVPTQQQPCFYSSALGAGAIPAPQEVEAAPDGHGGLSAVHASCEPSQAEACGVSPRLGGMLYALAVNGGACSASVPAQTIQSGGDQSSACCQLGDFADSEPSVIIAGHPGADVELVHPAFCLPAIELRDAERTVATHEDSHSASSCNSLLVSFDGLGPEQQSNVDGGGSEDPSLSHDSGDSVDMVLLPMEEEIEPVLRMGGLMCAGGADIDSASSGVHAGNMCDEQENRYQLDAGHLRGAGAPGGVNFVKSAFYELIKTVSTTDSYMRFYDKDGHDVQREPVSGSDDEHSAEDKADRLRVDRVMIWNEYEAYVMQFKQIAVSACGQTAVLNVLKALKIPCEKAAVCKVIQGSLRKEDAGIPEYLFSRAVAGTTAEELMSGIETLSGGTVGGRFFPFWPPRKIKLLQWLAYWMKRGAIPVATLNLQQGPHSLWQVPDSWHHQMVYGVSHQGLYLTNPLEIVSERSAMKQLCSDSVLMVRRQDIISRYRKTTDLGELLTHPDHRWSTMNVLGQVVNVLREFNMPSVPGYRVQVTSHVSIPACYKAGVTLFMRKDRPSWSTLLNAPDVPIENQETMAEAVGGQSASLLGACAL